MIRFLLTVLISGYLGAGLFGGMLMQRAIPPMNALGVAYITLTWPRQMICATPDSGCSNTPPEWISVHMFSND